MTTIASYEVLKAWKCFGGTHMRVKHRAPSLGNEATAVFALYLPPAAATSPVPAVLFLSGLTCDDQNFSTKAGAQQAASKLGIALIAPDTSPRGANLGAVETASWSLGVGAGYYVNATQAPWNAAYQMEDYVLKDLLQCISTNFHAQVDTTRLSISGHSMGGHGALTLALRHPHRFRSVSAFSPIAHPSRCPWGIAAFTAFLGEDRSQWSAHDATELMRSYTGPELHIRVEQGGADEFLTSQLLPQDFLEAAAAAGVSVEYHARDGYDHSYFFISTFIGEHLEHHARFLR